MLRVVTLLTALLCFVAAQQINFPAGLKGTRSLWIPYRTISGVPFASILDHDQNNHTTYVISCPTDQPECALAPNLTLTEGTDLARWQSSTSGATSGTVNIICPSLTAPPVTCFQEAHGDGDVLKTSEVVPQSEIVYQEVHVTALQKNTATGHTTKPKTATPTPTPSTTSTSSARGVPTVTAGPLAMMGGAIGVGLLALAAL